MCTTPSLETTKKKHAERISNANTKLTPDRFSHRRYTLDPRYFRIPSSLLSLKNPNKNRWSPRTTRSRRTTSTRTGRCVPLEFNFYAGFFRSENADMFASVAYACLLSCSCCSSCLPRPSFTFRVFSRARFAIRSRRRLWTRVAPGQDLVRPTWPQAPP